MADGAAAGQAGDHAGVGEIVADQPEATMRVKAGAIVADDAGCLLAAML